ncbi:hypothetical protein HYH03_005457 [Edaphochlamys debaryana]|uniref:Ion transport domain-containing protein n=1 Tax=Edaphochlamys debaryana TaxID=47281 RepID=A0A835Y5A4_9CHLO|nr:hypothetical protein HYH03_005457 [Edaphochlamys debaryana]|eukprot:KAG2496637.1 hypothetical protein HYH03_005457 [Edaphochlamys debaryana]
MEALEEPPERGKETSEVRSPPAEDRLLSSELKSITEHDAQAKLGQQLAAFAGGGAQNEAQAEPSLLEPLWRWLARLNENDRSWYMFSPGNLFRKVVQAVTDAPMFGKLVLTVVFANCIVMAMQPGVCDPACERGSYARTLAVLDTVFTILFTVEIALQTIAKNFILGPGAYLHDGWNGIDFVSTATGYLAFIPFGADGGGITGLRALRALRPLRALKVIPGLKVLVQCLLEILPLLVDVLFLLVWVFIVFGIIALNLFMGSLRTRCVYADLSLPPGMPLPPSSPAPPGAGNGTWGTPASPPTDWLKNATWVDEAKKNATWIVVPDLEDQPCSYGSDNGAFQCPSDYNGLPVSCAKGYSNPNYGYAGYDNFGLASFNIFAVLTLDAWTEEQLYLQWDVMGPGIPIVFFALLVLFGAFFTMQDDCKGG